MLELLQLDFVQSAILIGVVMGVTLAYLGVHVVGRGIVFVDLALGQISMLGVAVAEFVEMDPTVVSIAFTMVGALILSMLKVTDPRLKVEAIIGIVFALASALTVLVISKSAHGDADISEVLFGSFFTVTDGQLLYSSLAFGAILAFHLAFRKKFFELTDRMIAGDTSTIRVFDAWNFLFYLTLGLAIVLAVRVGGVIPVFAYLVVPALSGILLARSRGRVIVLGLAVSVLGTLLGIYFSLSFDFPAGSSVVALLGVLFIAASAARLGFLRRAQP